MTAEEIDQAWEKAEEYLSEAEIVQLSLDNFLVKEAPESKTLEALEYMYPKMTFHLIGNEVFISNVSVEEACSTGTHFMGHTIKASYLELMTLFGSPHELNIDGKVRAQWALTIDGKVYTIYDGKSSFNPTLSYKKMLNWHIGSHSESTAERAQEKINGKLNKMRRRQ